MNINYYANFFSFRLPVYMVICLLLACSKLDSRYNCSNRYHCSKRKAAISNVEAPPSKRGKHPIILSLFEAIKKSDIHEVKKLLKNDFFKGVAIVNLCETDSTGNTCLHIAAGIKEGNKDVAAAIMKILLCKMRPLLLSKEDREYIFCDAQCDESRIIDFVAVVNHTDYHNDDMKITADYMHRLLEALVDNYSNIASQLLAKNIHGETPLMIAMKRGTLQIIEYLLEDTHSCVGINLAHHEDDTDLNFLDIALHMAIERNDDSRFNLVLDALQDCLVTHPLGNRDTTYCTRYSNNKCMCENIVTSMATHIHKSESVFCVEFEKENPGFYKKFLKMMSNILEFGDFLYFFFQLYTNNEKFYTNKMPFSKRISIANGFKMKFSKYLVERSSKNKEISSEAIKFTKKFKNTAQGWLQSILVKQRELLAERSHTGEIDIHTSDTLSNNYEQEVDLLINYFEIWDEWKEIYLM